MFAGAQEATAFRAEGCGGGFAAIFEVSVTGFSFSVIWQNNHSADWLAALATPYPGCAGLPPMQGAEQPMLSVEQLMKRWNREALLCPLEEGERWWRQPPKGECISDARRAVVKVFS